MQKAARKVFIASGGGHDLMTVSEGWEKYAREHASSLRVGDEWNRPRASGIDVKTSEAALPYLDRNVFEPFLGTCDIMLEIGPGGGRFTEVLLSKCKKLIAAETSATMLKLLRERFGDDVGIEYYLADGRGLGKVADDSVDAAFSYGVFVHLQHWDIYNYLAELQRVLKPGGKAIVQYSNTFSEMGWKRFRNAVPKQVNRHKIPGTFIVNTPELMREFIIRARLECVDVLTEIVRRDCIALIRKPAN
jgi:SAM-dependent methyltransferase